MDKERVIHDWLLENKPEAAKHEPTTCKFCIATDQEKGKVAEAETKIFTQEQHEQLLASAVEKARTEATTKLDTDVVKLNDRIKELEKASEDKDTKVKELETKIEERTEQDRLDALANDRSKLVKESANFTDEQIEARKVQWAKMSEDDFKVYLEDIGEVAKGSVKAEDKEKALKGTSFDATRSTAGEKGTEKSVIDEFFGYAPALSGQL